MKIDLIFDTAYNIELVEELQAEERLYIPNQLNTGGNDGVMVRITPDVGEAWIGVFAFGNFSVNGYSGIYAMPDKNKVCIVSRGAGYIVNVNSPGKYEEVKAIPVTDVKCVESENIILFADYTRVVAYGEAGIKWETGRLAYDGFKIVSIDNNVLKGKFWNIRSEEDEIFEVNLVNGSVVGGVGEF